jgi:hypothetical protein
MEQLHVVRFPKAKADIDPSLQEIIDSLGKASAEAQKLHFPITSIERLTSSKRVDEVVYVLRSGTEGKALLRVGKRRLFLPTRDGSGLKEYRPLCVLDFYSAQKGRGFGSKVFMAMLEDRNVTDVTSLAFDRPSTAMKSFLKSRFGIQSLSEQANRYAIAKPEFYSSYN